MIKLITFIIIWGVFWSLVSSYLWYTFIKIYKDPDYLAIIFYCSLAVLSIFITIVPIIYKILVFRHKNPDNEKKPLLQQLIINGP